MKKSNAIILFLLLASVFIPTNTLARSNRIALVIGNASYQSENPLVNTLNDARDMKAQLKALGFEVIYAENSRRSAMGQKINQFIRRIRGGQQTALFYYSGHGLQVDGTNYLLPVDAQIKDELDVSDQAISTNKLLRAMKRRPDAVNLVILDACRNNPYQSKKGGSKGLSRIGDSAGGGTKILYATRPGETADDNPHQRNGLFTKHLLTAIRQPGIEVESAFRQVGQKVYRESNKKQLPWSEGILFEPFYFSGEGQNTQSSIQIASADPDMASKDEREFWQEVKADPSQAMYEAYLAEYPTGRYIRIARIKLKKYEAKADKPGHLTIRSNVSGDQVTLNGKRYGNTRLDLTLPSGEYELVISKSGYEDYTETVHISSGSQQTIRGHLNRKGVDLSAYGIDMVSIPGGRFQMGSPSSEEGRDDEEKQHSVYVNNFKINRTEVILKGFKQFVSATGYRTDAEKDKGGYKGCYSFKNNKWSWNSERNYKTPGFNQSGSHPVSCVSHNDALAYIKWLNGTTGKAFRLPTEAEWEYAARGGKSSARFWGNNADNACRYANVADKNTSDGRSWNTKHNCDDGYNVGTSPVGNYRSNPYGLKDILGNVWEWTCSAYSKSYDGSEKRCSDSAEVFSLRGGAWDNTPTWVRSAYRNWYVAFYRLDDIGFRLVQVD